MYFPFFVLEDLNRNTETTSSVFLMFWPITMNFSELSFRSNFDKIYDFMFNINLFGKNDHIPTRKNIHCMKKLALERWF